MPALFSRHRFAPYLIATLAGLGSSTLGLSEGAARPGDAGHDVASVSFPTSGHAAATGATSTSSDGAPLALALELVWEGRDLEAYNLDAVRALRAAFPELAIVHFVSPAYFLRKDVDPAAAAAKIKALIGPNDRVGLAFGGWRSLATAAGVIFRGSPTFWGEALRPLDCKGDCGQDVPLNVYPEADLDKLVQTAVKTLDQQGFGMVRGVMTSGWVASPEVLEASGRAGLRYDFSAVAPEMLTRRALQYPLYGWVKSLWPAVTPHSQPYGLPGNMTEVPQGAAAIDYVNLKDLGALFQEYVELAKHGDDGKTLVLPLAFYQETAAANLPLVRRAVADLKARAQAAGLKLGGLDAPLGFGGMEPQGAAYNGAPVAH